MATAELLFHSEAGEFRLPGWVNDYQSFRKWAREDRPEKSRVGYYAGLIWADVSMEQAYTHNDVKSEIAGVLRMLTKRSGLGRMFGDGMQLSIPAVELTTVPDAMYVSESSFDSGRVRQIDGARQGVVELEGPPDMVLEVVSDSSVNKDNVRLPEAYGRGGVEEFWRVDARGTEVVFDILRLQGESYVPVEADDGWRRSEAFGREFRLVHDTDTRGHLISTLEHRD